MNNNISPLVDIQCICFLIVCAFVTVMPVQMLAQDFHPATCYGGKHHLKDFLAEHMVYPRAELARGNDGSVSLSFDIDAKGLPQQVKIIQSSGPAFSDEASRLFRLLLWEPASINGKNVSVHQDLTINFNAKHYLKTCQVRGYDTLTYAYRPVDTTLKIYACRLAKIAPEPIFFNPENSWQLFIARNLRYPVAARIQNVTGIVNVNFVIEPYGIVSNMAAESHLGAGCEEEAIRLVKLTRWKPGIVNGKAARVNMNLAIPFGPEAKGLIPSKINQTQGTTQIEKDQNFR